MKNKRWCALYRMFNQVIAVDLSKTTIQEMKMYENSKLIGYKYI